MFLLWNPSFLDRCASGIKCTLKSASCQDFSPLISALMCVYVCVLWQPLCRFRLQNFHFSRCPVLWNAKPERLTDRVSVLEKKGKKEYGLLLPFYSSESTKNRPAFLRGFYSPMKLDISFSCSGNSDPIRSFSHPR